MRYTLERKVCNIRNMITNDNIKNNLYVCPVCHTNYKIEINKNKELGYLAIN